LLSGVGCSVRVDLRNVIHQVESLKVMTIETGESASSG